MYSAGMDSSVIAHRQRSLSNYSSREEIVAWNVFSIRIVSTTLKARQRRKVSGLAFPLSLSFFFCVLVSCHLPASICSGTEAMQNKTAVGLSPHGRWQPFSISYQSEQKLFHESQHLPHAEGLCSKLRAVPARLTD